MKKRALRRKKYSGLLLGSVVASCHRLNATTTDVTPSGRPYTAATVSDASGSQPDTR
jgi:hypothetical protein